MYSEFETRVFYLILFTVFLFRLCVKHIDTFTYSIIIFQYTKLETHRNLIDPYLINLYTGNTVLIVGVSQAGFFPFFFLCWSLCSGDQECKNENMV